MTVGDHSAGCVKLARDVATRDRRRLMREGSRSRGANQDGRRPQPPCSAAGDPDVARRESPGGLDTGVTSQLVRYTEVRESVGKALKLLEPSYALGGASSRAHHVAVRPGDDSWEVDLTEWHAEVGESGKG